MALEPQSVSRGFCVRRKAKVLEPIKYEYISFFLARILARKVAKSSKTQKPTKTYCASQKKMLFYLGSLPEWFGA